MGPTSAKAKANYFSTQEFNDASRHAVFELNAEVQESHSDQPNSTPELFSFDSPAASPISGAEFDQPISQPHDSYSGRAYRPRGVYKVLKSARSEILNLVACHGFIHNVVQVYLLQEGRVNSPGSQIHPKR